MEKMNNKTMWWIGAGVVVIAVVIAVIMTNQAKPVATTQPATDQAQTPTPAPAATPSTTPNLSYTEALAKYGTNRIQFNASCQTQPSSVTYKSGTMVMFDNRSTVSHTITFAGTKYTIAGDGYKILTMTAAKYPATLLIDCDKSQNVTTILIQK